MAVDEKYLVSRPALALLKDPKALKEKMTEGATFQKILGFSDEAVLGFYDAANEMLEKQRYEDAGDAFFFLTQLAPHVKTFWLGLARSEHLNHHVEQAIALYVTAIAMEEGDKDVYMECVRCCLAANKLEEAIQILDLALEFCSEHPELPETKDLHDTSIECKEWILSQQKGKE